VYLHLLGVYISTPLHHELLNQPNKVAVKQGLGSDRSVVSEGYRSSILNKRLESEILKVDFRAATKDSRNHGSFSSGAMVVEIKKSPRNRKH
jgi:hypothetical protein